MQAGGTVAWEFASRSRPEVIVGPSPVMTAKKIFIGSDHAGFELRGRIAGHLRALGLDVEDLGTPTAESTDYPDWGAAVGRAVRDHAGSLGVLVCGSGIGVCMAANKIHGVRAAVAWSIESARLSRAHNDANVLCIGERGTSERDALAMVDAWLATEFEGGRHARRVGKIAAIEAEERGS
jgi:ribose 5-phosphate isomerase B